MKISRILIVEDDPSDAELIKIMLKSVDARTELSSADRLSSALSFVDADSFDAVLLDLNLPDSMGLDTLSKIQERASHSALIVLTGLDDENIGERAVELGAQEYLVKGHFTIDALRRVLRYAVGRKHGQLRLQKAEALSEARNRINDVISSTLDFDEIMNRVIGEAAKSIAAEAGLIGSYVEGGFAVRNYYGLPDTSKGYVMPEEEFKALAALKETGRPVISADAQTDGCVNPEVAKRYGIHAAMFLPLFVEGSVAGALAFFNFSPRTFDDLEIDSVRKIAASLSLALENAQLYEECRSAETDLRKKSAELEKKSGELKSSNRELEQFASMASHDLQEPLVSLASAIKLGLKRLKGKTDEETLQVLSNATNSAENMQKMVRNLLAYSRVGKQPSFEHADLDKVFELALRNLASLVEKTGAVVTHDPLPRLYVDPILLSQLFQNLIGNAIKYRSDRLPEIHISVELRGDQQVFCVRDNGVGIPEEHREAVFQIFKRIPGVKRTPGSGVGLATCKKIVELHGGRIWVESEEGKGSRFFFSLPAAGEAVP
ncbi:MAG: response regulator [Nitrospirae bacterium]|nr:response regulator [Nitrospirota bacterium]